MSKTEHTKGEWQVKDFTEHNEDWVIESASKEWIATDLSEANARHIVKCVNSHDELVEALQFVFDYGYFDEATWKKAKAVLAKVKEETE